MCGKGGDTSPERKRREGNNRPVAGALGLCLPIVRNFPGEPYFDTCWDLWKTVDYLSTRPDTDPEKIGMIGFSMGGMRPWNGSGSGCGKEWEKAPR